jgi:hypothetical protein
MRWPLIVGCMALAFGGPVQSAPACNGRLGGGVRGISGAGMFSVGLAQLRMMAAQEQLAAAQRAEAHRKHVSTYTALRDKKLADRETRRQTRLAGHTADEAHSSASFASARPDD